jgi:mono/diheme cytochrome c family protein
MQARPLRLLGMLLLISVSFSALLAGCASSAGTGAQAPAAAPASEQASPTSAPEAAPTATQPPAPASEKPTEVSFAKDVLPIFEAKCVKCHGGNRTEAKLVLKSYDGVMAGSEDGPVITPGDSTNSTLVEVIVEGRMPKRDPRLPDSEIAAIKAWVDAGAPNN